ncbi:MAG TPA: hypothetical protein VID04_05645 [Methylomirabilota bacterium]|jgi:hypothetical protein
MTPRVAVALLIAVALVGCSGQVPKSTTHTPSSRGQCITDKGETPTRPMIFLFCVETP